MSAVILVGKVLSGLIRKSCWKSYETVLVDTVVPLALTPPTKNRVIFKHQSEQREHGNLRF